MVEQNDYHYRARNYLATAIIHIRAAADFDTEIKAAEDNLKFEMGIN